MLNNYTNYVPMGIIDTDNFKIPTDTITNNHIKNSITPPSIPNKESSYLYQQLQQSKKEHEELLEQFHKVQDINNKLLKEVEEITTQHDLLKAEVEKIQSWSDVAEKTLLEIKNNTKQTIIKSVLIGVVINLIANILFNYFFYLIPM